MSGECIACHQMKPCLHRWNSGLCSKKGCQISIDQWAKMRKENVSIFSAMRGQQTNQFAATKREIWKSPLTQHSQLRDQKLCESCQEPIVFHSGCDKTIFWCPFTMQVKNPQCNETNSEWDGCQSPIHLASAHCLPIFNVWNPTTQASKSSNAHSKF